MWIKLKLQSIGKLNLDMWRVFKITPTFLWPSSDRFDILFFPFVSIPFDLQVQAKLEEAFEMASDRREAGPEILGDWADQWSPLQFNEM